MYNTKLNLKYSCFDAETGTVIDLTVTVTLTVTHVTEVVLL